MSLILWGLIGLFIGVSIGLANKERKEIQKKQEELEKKVSALAKNVYSHPDFKDVEV